LLLRSCTELRLQKETETLEDSIIDNLREVFKSFQKESDDLSNKVLKVFSELAKSNQDNQILKNELKKLKEFEGQRGESGLANSSRLVLDQNGDRGDEPINGRDDN